MSTSRLRILVSVLALLLVVVSVLSNRKSFAAPANDSRRRIGVNTVLQKEQLLPNGLLTRTFRSEAEWSGKGGHFSDWYVMKTAPTPAGYKLWSQSFSLEGDRMCMGVGDLISVKQLDHDWDVAEVTPWQDQHIKENRCGWAEASLFKRDDEAVMWAFSMQGHNEGYNCVPTITEGIGVKCDRSDRSSQSLGIVTVNYAPPTYTGKIKRDYNCDPTKIDLTVDCYFGEK